MNGTLAHLEASVEFLQKMMDRVLALQEQQEKTLANSQTTLRLQQQEMIHLRELQQRSDALINKHGSEIESLKDTRTATRGGFTLLQVLGIIAVNVCVIAGAVAAILALRHP